MSVPQVRGQFLGRAGRGLDDADWGSSREVTRIGQDAELETGRILRDFTAQGPSVINDLRIPIPGFNANIDHVVISGSQVLVIDSKAWAGGLYWTAGGRTRRGSELFPFADKKTLPTAVTALERFLRMKGISAVSFQTPVLAVWPTGPANFMLYRPAGGAAIVQGNRFATWLNRNVKPKPARGDIMVALAELANTL